MTTCRITKVNIFAYFACLHVKFFLTKLWGCGFRLIIKISFHIIQKRPILDSRHLIVFLLYLHCSIQQYYIYSSQKKMWFTYMAYLIPLEYISFTDSILSSKDLYFESIKYDRYRILFMSDIFLLKKYWNEV